MSGDRGRARSFARREAWQRSLDAPPRRPRRDAETLSLPLGYCRFCRGATTPATVRIDGRGACPDHVDALAELVGPAQLEALRAVTERNPV